MQLLRRQLANECLARQVGFDWWRPDSTIQMRVLAICDEKLAAVGIRAAVGHGHDPAFAVAQAVDNLVRKLARCRAEYALPALAGARGVP